MDINEVPQSHPEPGQKPLESIAGEEMDKRSDAEKEAAEMQAKADAEIDKQFADLAKNGGLSSAAEEAAHQLIGQYVEILDESIKNQTTAYENVERRLIKIEEILSTIAADVKKL